MSHGLLCSSHSTTAVMAFSLADICAVCAIGVALPGFGDPALAI